MRRAGSSCADGDSTVIERIMDKAGPNPHGFERNRLDPGPFQGGARKGRAFPQVGSSRFWLSSFEDVDWGPFCPEGPPLSVKPGLAEARPVRRAKSYPSGGEGLARRPTREGPARDSANTGSCQRWFNSGGWPVRRRRPNRRSDGAGEGGRLPPSPACACAAYARSNSRCAFSPRIMSAASGYFSCKNALTTGAFLTSVARLVCG